MGILLLYIVVIQGATTWGFDVLSKGIQYVARMSKGSTYQPYVL